ncbi:hypothetical protein NP493_1g10014 [Ridgeia piscesae]|uniref:Uncharacterized protein n=1 Tax=Ridgeia piscesae TaxID=27915 RepID=A0AAD9PGV0_RIDPI|nr:hypothetical protein NP493_1g10014 [Ridgeia piscesae]
MTLLFLPHQ